jgi:hypothetical protein
MDLTNEDVADILALLDSLPYDSLDVETPRFRLTLRRATGGGWTEESRVLTEPARSRQPRTARQHLLRPHPLFRKCPAQRVRPEPPPLPGPVSPGPPGQALMAPPGLARLAIAVGPPARTD